MIDTTKPLYILAATPPEGVKIRNFFERGENTVIQFLEEPGELRRLGWSLRTLDRARIVDGEYLEVSNGTRKTLELHENGTLLFYASADRDFLGHAAPPEAGALRINPTALVEITYNFVHFYAQLLKYFTNRQGKINFDVRFENLLDSEEHPRVYLVPGKIGLFGHDEPGFPSKKSFNKNQDFDFDTLEKKSAHVAYKLLQQAYACFGLTSDAIPYTITKDDLKEVDIETIRSVQ